MKNINFSLITKSVFRIRVLILFSVITALLFTSCNSNEPKTEPELTGDNKILSFGFKKADKNPITVDVNGAINGANITLTVITESENLKKLTANFKVSDKATLKIGTKIQESGSTVNDFTNPVTYTVTAEDGTTQDYKVTVTAKPYVIEVKNDTIFFRGEINPKSGKEFKEVFNDNKQAVKKVLVNSPGGEVVSGIGIGEVIFDNGLDIEVEEFCFSSCANYMFPAAKNKVIQKNAIVGWHGSLHQDFILARLEGITEEEYSRRELTNSFTKAGLTGTDLNKEINDGLAYNTANRKVENDFYKKIGVDRKLPIFGLAEQVKQKKGGFTFSLEDMKKFKINNITYLGGGEYYTELPDTHPIKQGIFLMKVEQAELDNFKVE